MLISPIGLAVNEFNHGTLLSAIYNFAKLGQIKSVQFMEVDL